eukprot:COSAG01_NODE_6009_length_3904_cov_36.533246_3_plen_362_part_00
MTPAELQEAGNELFRAQRYAAAAESYSAALEAVDGERQQAGVNVQAVLLNNRAIANLRCGRVEAAIADTTRALEMLGDGNAGGAGGVAATAGSTSNTMIKALMRRAEARVQLHDYGAAVRDYSAALRAQRDETERLRLTPIEQPRWVPLALVRRALARESLGRIDALQLALRDLRSAHQVRERGCGALRLPALCVSTTPPWPIAHGVFARPAPGLFAAVPQAHSAASPLSSSGLELPPALGSLPRARGWVAWLGCAQQHVLPAELLRLATEGARRIERSLRRHRELAHAASALADEGLVRKDQLLRLYFSAPPPSALRVGERFVIAVHVSNELGCWRRADFPALFAPPQVLARPGFDPVRW